MTVSTEAEDRFWVDVFPRVATKAIEREPALGMNIGDYSRELRRFLELARHSTVPLAMISERIDALWHEFVNHTTVYRDYCERFVGHFLDHMPRSDWFPIPDAAVGDLIMQYKTAHGALPDSWFDGMDPAAARELRNGINPAGLKWSGYVPPTAASKLL